MNILFINSARTWGGTEKWVFMAAHALAAEHSTFLVYRRNIVGDRFSVPKFQLPCLSHLDLYTIMQVIRIIRKHHIDVLIPTKRKDYLVAGIASKLCGITNILRLGIDRPPSDFWFHRLMYDTLVNGIIVNAQKTRESLLRVPWLKADTIRVIYNGIDTEAIDRQFPSGLPCKPEGFTVCSMGILTRRKGFDFLIRGFARFIELSDARDAQLVIIGSGPEQSSLRTLANELGIGSLLRFTGFLDNPLPELARGHLFAMVSKNEGIANALLEGMYLGNAPISTRAGGAGEVIIHNSNGYLLDYGDIEALSAALLSLYQSPELRNTFARQARKRIIEQFSMERMKNEIAGFCQETLQLIHAGPVRNCCGNRQ
ncbi:MAG: glycosyltransferase [Chlorobiaceae bacterium]|nr:glycosyltransferase [Chlorobiaceae bacterium]